MTTTEAGARPIRSLIPARLDRLGWSPLHTRMACGLGGPWNPRRAATKQACPGRYWLRA